MRIALGSLVAVLVVGGCTWVKVSEEGAQVRVVQPHELGGCKRLASTTSKGVDHIMAAKRIDEVVERELRDMARNEAARIGGDTIVAESTIEDGRQTFGVYKCR